MRGMTAPVTRMLVGKQLSLNRVGVNDSRYPQINAPGHLALRTWPPMGLRQTLISVGRITTCNKTGWERVISAAVCLFLKRQ